MRSKRDLDQDGFSTAEGDCDDKEASVFPGAFERCNGRDDGQWQDRRRLRCWWHLSGRCWSLCGGGRAVLLVERLCGGLRAEPKMPVDEICDGEDNDCNLLVDDVKPEKLLTPEACGKCGARCPAPLNAMAVCAPDPSGAPTCTGACPPGFIDVDNNPKNGCEYKCEPTGPEICDGIDNDCDTKIDEDIKEEFYDGPAGTSGVGVCDKGVRVCRDGNFYVEKPQSIPTSESCDMLDNDCDGLVDEDCQNTCPCNTSNVCDSNGEGFFAL